jgi:hypothetical protein
MYIVQYRYILNWTSQIWLPRCCIVSLYGIVILKKFLHPDPHSSKLWICIRTICLSLHISRATWRHIIQTKSLLNTVKRGKGSVFMHRTLSTVSFCPEWNGSVAEKSGAADTELGVAGPPSPYSGIKKKGPAKHLQHVLNFFLTSSILNFSVTESETLKMI